MKKILLAHTATVALCLWGGASIARALPPSNPAFQQGFPVELQGDHVRAGSVSLGDLTGDDTPEIIVGASDGRLYAYRGNGQLLWSTQLGSVSIEGKAAVGDVDGDGQPEVVVGVGSNFTPNGPGRLFVLDHLGDEQCRFETLPPPALQGVFSSPALADLDQNDQGKLEIVFGAWDHHVRAIHHDCTVLWDREVYDTVYSSPAVADLDNDGLVEVVIGADAHDHPPTGMEDGGRLFVFEGTSGQDRTGFPIQIDEVIHSSPAIGDIDGDGWQDIVVGTGDCYGATSGCGARYHPGAGEYINAWDRFGNPLQGWPVSTPTEITYGSPALGDLDGDGDLEVVVNTLQRGTTPQEGHVYVFNGDGSVFPGWPVMPSTPADCQGNVVHFGARSSPVLGDLDGDGTLEVLLGSKSEVVVWGLYGEQLSRTALVPPGCQPPNPDAYQLVTGWTFGGSPALGDIDGDRDLEVVAAGYMEINDNAGGLWAWDLPAKMTRDQSWPMFRRSQENDGMMGVRLFGSGFESGDLSGWD